MRNQIEPEYKDRGWIRSEARNHECKALINKTSQDGFIHSFIPHAYKMNECIEQKTNERLSENQQMIGRSKPTNGLATSGLQTEPEP